MPDRCQTLFRTFHIFQNAQRSENLMVAKDWAQMTATTAMSVVHVALLKSVSMRSTFECRAINHLIYVKLVFSHRGARNFATPQTM